jgi:predicted esterase
MAFRAAARAGHQAHGLIALGGDIPPELASDFSVTWPPVVLGRGTTDAYYPADRFDADAAVLASHGALNAQVSFDGGHEWSDAFRAAVGTFLASL